MTSIVEPRSLATARAAIPDACYARSRLHSIAGIVVDGIVYAGALGGMIIAADRWFALPLMVLAGLATAGLFVLGHDASHGALFDGRTTNRTVARVLMLPSMHVQEAWVLGHNRVHHGFTARQGMDFVWHPVTADEYAAMSPWARARHRVEWSWIGAGAYYLREVWWNKMVTFRPPAKHAGRVRRDWFLTFGSAGAMSIAALAIGWVRGGTVLDAARMWLLLVAGPFVVFGYLIGWTVYVHHVGPGIRWWRREDWTPWRAQMLSTTVLRAPWLLNVLFHNIFVHVPHHVDPSIPWYRLPMAAAALEDAVPGVIVDEPLRLRDYVRATRSCKLYDFDAGCWLGYPRRA